MDHTFQRVENIAVIFDMDGVIVDTNPFHIDAFKKFFTKHAISFDEADFIDHMYGKHNSYILSHFMKRPIVGDELRALEDEKESCFRDLYGSHVEPLRGFEDFLADLKSRGIKTGVGTSAPRANMDLVAAKLGLYNKMESFLASEDVTQHKPHPEVYLNSARNLGVEPQNCLVFEDSHSGVSAALAAGCKVVGVMTSHTKMELPPCDAYIGDFTEISLDRVQEMLR